MTTHETHPSLYPLHTLLSLSHAPCDELPRVGPPHDDVQQHIRVCIIGTLISFHFYHLSPPEEKRRTSRQLKRQQATAGLSYQVDLVRTGSTPPPPSPSLPSLFVCLIQACHLFALSSRSAYMHPKHLSFSSSYALLLVLRWSFGFIYHKHSKRQQQQQAQVDST